MKFNYTNNMMNLHILQTEMTLIVVLGMTHIKRAKVAEEAKKEAVNPMKGIFEHLNCIIYLTK